MKKVSKRRWALLFGAILCLFFLAVSAETTTVMMYMCGTDLQSDCLNDIREMTQASFGDEVNLVVLAGGAKKWDDSALQAGRLNLFTIPTANAPR